MRRRLYVDPVTSVEVELVYGAAAIVVQVASYSGRVIGVGLQHEARRVCDPENGPWGRSGRLSEDRGSYRGLHVAVPVARACRQLF